MGKKYNYYSFVNEISTNFLKSYSFDKAINKSLKIILKRTKSDRTYIFLFSEDGKIMNNTHEYCKKGIEPQIANLKNIDTSELNWWIDSLKTDKIINIEDVSKMPKDASVEKKALESQNIRSLICFPFFIEKELIGFIGIDNVKDTGTWKDESIDYLKISAGLICKAIEKELINNEISQINSTLQATLETSDDAIVVIKKDSTILNYNENFIKLWNIQDEVRSNSNKVTMEVAKKTLLSPNPDEFQKRIEDTLSDPIKKDKFVAYRVDQSSIEITSRPLYVKNEHIGRVWKCTDITKQKSYEQRLQVISKVFEKSTDAILITDEFVRIIEINKAFENITGYSSDEVIGKNPSILQSNWHDERFYKEIWNSLDNKGYWEGEIWDRRKNGETYVNKTFISKIENKGAITNYIGISKDITQSKEYENKIKQLAFYDALTGLPNRTFFEQNLESVIDECNRYDRRFALLFIDLDNFKYVNDTFGHLTGDKLLQDVSNKLQKNVRKSDIVARLGGDEFTIIIKDLKNNLDIDKVANKIIKDISEPIIIDGNELHVGTSIGICIYPDDTSDSKELTKKADMAMYNSKNNGKNQYSFFCEEMNIAIQKRYKIEQAMRESIYQEDFYLEYQPFMSCGSDSVNTVEALIRWNHPSLGKVMPGEFISIAEENGMILKLGEWVFEKVCKDIDIFKRYNIQKISINISPKQLMDCNFVLNIEELIKKYKIETSLLEFEITETILMDTSGIVVDNLNRLKELGITFALDDFGTGYSSLNYIKHFSVDTIKIDKSFINTMCHDEKDMAIVNTIIYLSNVLDKNIVAEGVETTEQLEHFKDHKKCNIQGYLFSKPLGLDSLTHMLENNKL